MMVTDAMVDAYIGTHIKYRHNPNSRELCRLSLEAALSCEAFGLKDAIKQTREIYEGVADVKDAMDYLEQLLERNSL